MAVRTHDTVVRWGGDEFLLLLDPVDDEASAYDVVRRVERVVAEPVSYRGHQLRVTASVGVAFARADEQVSADELIRVPTPRCTPSSVALGDTPAVSRVDGQRV
jgi:diguanylate cyclase (GGDEF)-like protein